MGMAFPLGMKTASAKSAFLTPWLWGINGATAVCSRDWLVRLHLISIGKFLAIVMRRIQAADNIGQFICIPIPAGMFPSLCFDFLC